MMCHKGRKQQRNKNKLCLQQLLLLRSILCPPAHNMFNRWYASNCAVHYKAQTSRQHTQSSHASTLEMRESVDLSSGSPSSKPSPNLCVTYFSDAKQDVCEAERTIQPREPLFSVYQLRRQHMKFACFYRLSGARQNACAVERTMQNREANSTHSLDMLQSGESGRLLQQILLGDLVLCLDAAAKGCKAPKDINI